MSTHAPSRPRLVLFDLDDTLFDHRHCTRAALAAVRRAHACFQQWTAEELERRHAAILEELHVQVIAAGLPIDEARRERFRRLFAAAGGVPDAATLEACAVGYKTDYIAAWRAVPGALALLERLRPEVRLGVVSNNLLREQLAKIAHCGIGPYLDVTVISEAAGVAKPDPRIFEQALEQAGCAPAEAVMVGDAWHTDIAGARAAGVHPIWINWDGVPAGDPAAAVPAFAGLEPLEPLVDAILAPRRAPAPAAPIEAC